MSLTTFAQRMKQAREKKGLKQNELAKAVGVTPTTISAYEKSDTDGNGKKPTLENAQAIAEVLGVSLDWLCGMADASGGEYADLTSETYLKSLVNILVETSCTVTEKGIDFNNAVVKSFIKKISDLIAVYHAGSIPKDLFNVCVDKVIKDYSGYEIFHDCFLSADESVSADNDMFNAFETFGAGMSAGLLQLCVTEYGRYGSDRYVSLFISQEDIDNYFNPVDKEVSDNGKHNKENE